LKRTRLPSIVLGQIDNSKTAATDLADYSELSTLFPEDLLSNHSDLRFLLGPHTSAVGFQCLGIVYSSPEKALERMKGIAITLMTRSFFREERVSLLESEQERHDNQC